MNDYSLYEKAYIADEDFPINIIRCVSKQQESVFYSHWHEQIEFVYIAEGSAVIQCNSVPIQVNQGEMLVVNSNELHSGCNTGGFLQYFCVIMDPALLKSSFHDSCEAKYIGPITQNLIRFSNRASHDETALECIKGIIEEYDRKDTGYELAVKSWAYRLMVVLLRNHMEKVLTQKEYEHSIKDLERLRSVLTYIESNFTEEIPVEKLAAMSCVSTWHFCHLFKKVTGKNLVAYITLLRINRAEFLLRNTGMNVTEVASASGFNDINYFSRVFKKYKSISPSCIRKTDVVVV